MHPDMDRQRDYPARKLSDEDTMVLLDIVECVERVSKGLPCNAGHRVAGATRHQSVHTITIIYLFTILGLMRASIYLFCIGGVPLFYGVH